MITVGKYYLKEVRYTSGDEGVVLFKPTEQYYGNNFITGEFLEFTKRGAITTFIRKSKGSILQTDDSYKEVHRILWENILSLSEDFWYDIEKIVKEHINFKQTDLEEVNTLTEWFNKTKD